MPDDTIKHQSEKEVLMKKYENVEIIKNNKTIKTFNGLSEYQFAKLTMRVIQISLSKELFDDIFVEYTLEGTRYVWYPSGYRMRAEDRPLFPGYDPELEQELQYEAKRLAWYY